MRRSLAAVSEPENLTSVEHGKPPLGNRFGSQRAAMLENRDRHNEVEFPKANIHPPIADLVTRNFIDERWQHGTGSFSERVENEAQQLRLIQPSVETESAWLTRGSTA